MADQPQGTGAEQHGGVTEEPSLVQELQRRGPMGYIKFAVAIFAVVGVGYGLTFWLFTELGSLGDTGGAFLVGVGSLFGFLLGPLVAVGTGAYTALDSKGEETQTMAAAAGVGAAAGYIVLVVVLVFFASLSSGGGGGGGGSSLPGGPGGTFGLLLGIAVTAALTVYLTVGASASS